MMTSSPGRYPWLSQTSSFLEWVPPPEVRDTAFAKRRLFFERHSAYRDGYAVCPACGYPTLAQRGEGEHCPFCHWNDDGQDDPWADLPNGGPNDHSLAVARRNVEETGTVWSFTEAPDFSIHARERLFSERAQRRKQALRVLYDGLMSLHEVDEIRRQWARITAL